MSDTVVHRKLVRDYIPAIIRTNGSTAVTRVLGPGDYRAALHAKLVEESNELLAAAPEHQLGELADLLDVLSALAADAGHTFEQVMDAAAAKTESRGGFEGRVWLEETRD